MEVAQGRQWVWGGMGKGAKQLLGGKYNMVVKGGRASWVTSSSSGASAPGPLGASWNRIFFILRYCRLSSSRTASLVLWIRSIMTVGGRSRSTKRCWGKRTPRLVAKHPYDPQYPMGAGIPSSLRQSPGTHVLMGGYWPCPNTFSHINFHHPISPGLFLHQWPTGKTSHIWIPVQVLYQSAACPWTCHEAS